MVRGLHDILGSIDMDQNISENKNPMDIALESKHVVKPKNGWYQRVDADGVIEEKNYREKDTDSKEFWMPILKQKSFQIKRTSQLQKQDSQSWLPFFEYQGS